MKEIILVSTIVIALCISCTPPSTEVVVCSTLHGVHKSNENYSYEDLFNTIRVIDPDIIGVEIRQEDKDSTVTYLSRYYPYEMHQTLTLFPSKITYGIDWLGSEIEGKPITKDYFQTLDVLKLARQAEEDSLFQQSLKGLKKLAALKDDIARQASIIDLNDGRYDSLNTRYYLQLNRLYSNTPYQPIARFYDTRDHHITDRILELVAQHRGKKLLFIVGADHRSRAVKALRELAKKDRTLILQDINEALIRADS